jgi:hypothetical protein
VRAILTKSNDPIFIRLHVRVHVRRGKYSPIPRTFFLGVINLPKLLLLLVTAIRIIILIITRPQRHHVRFIITTIIIMMMMMI